MQYSKSGFSVKTADLSSMFVVNKLTKGFEAEIEYFDEEDIMVVRAVNSFM